MEQTIQDILQEASIKINQQNNAGYISTGSLKFDYLLRGGLPRSKITMFGGPQHSGKSTMALIAASSALKEGNMAVYIDTEGSFNPKWAKLLGVDGKNFQHIGYDCHMESVMDDVLKIVATKKIDLIILDSLQGLPFRAESEGSMEDTHMMVAARKNSLFFRKLLSQLQSSQTAILITSQVRQNTNRLGPQGPLWVWPGGETVRHAASIRVEFPYEAKRDPVQSSKPQNGFIVRPRIIKSRFGSSINEKTEIYVMSRDEYGINYIAELTEVGKMLGVFTSKDGKKITGASKWYFDGEMIGYEGDVPSVDGVSKNELAVRVSLKLDNDLYQKVDRAIRAKIQEMSK